MMRVARLAPTDEAALVSDKAHVIAIADTPWLRVHQNSLVNRLRRQGSFPAVGGLGTGGLCILLALREPFGTMHGKAQKLGPKRLLNMLGIGRIELVFLLHPPVRPLGRLALVADCV
jgi:hypothetical protein